MTATLNFLNTRTDARTLARPRILTLNNETAKIEISTDQAISIEQTQTSTGTSGGATISGNTVERYTTGVVLKVTPQANLLTREITMAVSPKVIDVILSQVQPSGTGTSQVFDPETRGSDSILKLRDGQSMVIGGLLREQTSNIVTKLPFLGDLPLIGAAFRSTNKSKNERELIIFLTPHIIDAPPSFQASSMNEAAGRIEEVDQTLNTYEFKRN
jgi:type II secretory pathway component GspD/PulD (secretin)